MGDFSFPKSHHLLRPSDFNQVYRAGARRHTGGFVLFRNPNGLEHPRLGLSVGRRYGNSVRRNRIKRLVREAVRLHWRTWRLGGSDVVVIAKRKAEGYDLEVVTSELSRVFTSSKRGR